MTVQLSEARLLSRVQATLGEGPVWDPVASALWFVDIEERAILRYRPADGDLRRWAAPSKVGWVFPSGEGRLLAGLSDGLYVFTPDDGRFELVANVEAGLPANRLNDATVAPDGAIWFGTMDQDEKDASGRFYRFDGRSVEDSGLPAACITNGPAISPDGSTLYTVDTLARRIDAHAIASDGSVLKSRVFAVIDPADGYPDGVTCDAEGGVWLGLWAGWSARRYDADGRISHDVRLPVANVTKVALGGSDGRTAFVTTARRGVELEALGAQPMAGDLFTFDAPFAGVPSPPARLPSDHKQSGRIVF